MKKKTMRMASGKQKASIPQVVETIKKKVTDLAAAVRPEAEGFKDKVTPKKIDDNQLFILKCGGCKKEHFRHAGYMTVLIPHIEIGGKPRMAEIDGRVMVCVSCKRAHIFVNGQVYDVTDRIDLKAWEKTEKEAHKATGPGGQC